MELPPEYNPAPAAPQPPRAWRRKTLAVLRASIAKSNPDWSPAQVRAAARKHLPDVIAHKLKEAQGHDQG